MRKLIKIERKINLLKKVIMKVIRLITQNVDLSFLRKWNTCVRREKDKMGKESPYKACSVEIIAARKARGKNLSPRGEKVCGCEIAGIPGGFWGGVDNYYVEGGLGKSWILLEKGTFSMERTCWIWNFTEQMKKKFFNFSQFCLFHKNFGIFQNCQ